jgi:hypothetical protein
VSKVASEDDSRLDKEVCISNTARIGKEYRFQLGKKFVIWHQGESDAARTKDEYKELRKQYLNNRKFYESRRSVSRSEQKKNIMKKIEKNVEDKIKSGEKITTEDLLAMRKA